MSWVTKAIVIGILSLALYAVELRYSGLFQPPLCGIVHHLTGDVYARYPTLASLLCPTYELHGTVEPGWESVRKVFENNLKSGNELGAQLSVYVKGKEVVHLWGNYAQNKDAYNHDSLQIVFSTTKAVTSLCVAMLADRGHLRYDAKVTDYWPEFGQNGKQDVLIRDVLQHRAGLSHFNEVIPRDVAHNLDALAEFIAKQPQIFPKNTKRVYHAYTRGFILNEIFRRADPQHRTIGQFVREEIARPLGVDFSVGFTLDSHSESEIESLKSRLVNLHQTSPAWTLVNLVLPYYLSDKLPFLISPLRSDLEVLLKLALDPDSFMAKAGLVLEFTDGTPQAFQDNYVTTQVPSAGGVTNGFAIAKIFSIVANGGEIDGKRFISKEGLKLALQPALPAEKDEALGNSELLTEVGWGHTVYYGMGGWGGWGGSIAGFNPEKQVSVGYAMNGMGVGLIGNTNSEALLAEIERITKTL